MSIMNLEQLKGHSLKLNHTEQKILVTKTSGEEISDFKNLERTYSIQGNNDLFFIIDGNMYINLPSNDVMNQLNYADFEQKDFIVSGLNFNDLRQDEKIKFILCIEEYLFYIQAMVRVMTCYLDYYESNEEENNTFETKCFSKVLPSEENIQMYIEKVRRVKLSVEVLIDKAKEWINIKEHNFEDIKTVYNFSENVQQEYKKISEEIKEIRYENFEEYKKIEEQYKKIEEQYKKIEEQYLKAKRDLLTITGMIQYAETDLYNAKEISLHLEEVLKRVENTIELLNNLKNLKYDFIKMYREKM